MKNVLCFQGSAVCDRSDAKTHWRCLLTRELAMFWFVCHSSNWKSVTVAAENTACVFINLKSAQIQNEKCVTVHHVNRFFCFLLLFGVAINMVKFDTMLENFLIGLFDNFLNQMHQLDVFSL